MSKIRPETCDARPGTPYIGRATALYLIRDAVEKRKGLIHGRLDGPNHRHCAMGCFWADNPKVSVDTNLIDEVAAVNDSLGPKASMRKRWYKVRSWLRWKLRLMSQGAKC